VSSCSWFAIGALAAMLACGHGGDHGVALSGTDLSCGSGTYIANGECLDLPTFSDASLRPDGVDASTDAGDALDDSEASTVDNPPDAGVDGPSGLLDPLAPCASVSNVFFVEAVYASNGPTVSATHTNNDATFDAGVPPPLQITVTVAVHSPTTFALALLGEGDAPAVPTPGTYKTGTSGIRVSLNLDAGLMAFDEGTVSIEDVQVDPGDGGPSRLHSLLLAYDLYNPAAQTARGCLRYIE
jgi:hypothetical protein